MSHPVIYSRQSGILKPSNAQDLAAYVRSGVESQTRITRLAQYLASNPFVLSIKSIDKGLALDLKMLAPLIEKHTENVSSAEDSYSYPYSFHRYCQTAEAPEVTVTFDDLTIDRRFDHGRTEGSGFKNPNPSLILDKLELMTRINPTLKRKPRFVVLFGNRRFGDGVKTYMSLREVRSEGIDYDVTGAMISCKVSLTFAKYGMS